MGHYEISALPWSFRQRISRWNFKEFWQVSGSRGRAREEPAATPLAPANQCVAPVGDLLINDKTRLLLLLLEPTTVGALWLENDLHENELEFESHMGRSKKNVRVTSDGIHAEIHKIWTCVAPAAPPLSHAAVNLCLQSEFSWRESPWNWSCNSAILRKSTVTWMNQHYVFTAIFRWSTFSSTVNLCNINWFIFSDTHCSFGPPILWHSPFHTGVSY